MAKKKKGPIKEACFNLWSMIVRARAGNQCEICGVQGTRDMPLEAHHLITRRVLAFAFELSNGCCLCKWHHGGSKFQAVQTDIIGAHSTNYAGQEAFQEWVRNSCHWEWLSEHKDNKPIPSTMYYSDYEDIKDGLMDELAELLEYEGPKNFSALAREFKKKYYK